MGTAAQIFLGDAFRRADATVVLPIDFTKIFYASLIGYFFFDQVPEIWIWIGAFVVFGAVFYNASRKSRLLGSLIGVNSSCIVVGTPEVLMIR